MILTIISVGEAPRSIREDFPTYPEMFHSLLSKSHTDLEFDTISVLDGEELPDPKKLNATLITGSPSSVYDSEPWISNLRDFIRWCALEKIPQIGVCFGHQLIAQALGGQVMKSSKGWGVGRHEYDFIDPTFWLKEKAPEKIALAVSHQDQIIEPPAGAVTTMSSEFTPFAALWYENAPIMSVQGHPEFSKEFASALYTARVDRVDGVPKAIESLKSPLDNDLISSWMVRFLNSALNA